MTHVHFALNHVLRHCCIPLVLSFLMLSGCVRRENPVIIALSPAGEEFVRIDRQGTTVLPNGRLITPRGMTLTVAPHPFGLVLSPDGRTAVTANSGTGPLSITIVHGITDARPRMIQVPPGSQTDRGVLASVYMGLAIAPGNDLVYVAGGQANQVYVFDLRTGARRGGIDCSAGAAGVRYPDGYIGDMVLSRDGKLLYAIDQTNFRLIVIDVEKQSELHSVSVGRYPFGIALSPDGTKAYVANVGMFAYAKVEGIDQSDLAKSALKFPASAYSSREMRDGYTVDNLQVPGLGNPNDFQACSVWTVDLASRPAPTVVARVKTGSLVGEVIEGVPAVGGSSPNSIAATPQYVFVSNGSNDNISVLESSGRSIIHTISLRAHRHVRNFRGVIPFGLTVSPDGRRLYVAEAGINAVGVVDTRTMQVIGHIPVGWFPAKVQVTPDGSTLVVANAKGFGSGPNGGKNYVASPEGTYIGSLMKGTVSLIPVPSDSDLREMTLQVVANNYRFVPAASAEFDWRRNNPVPLYPGERESPIKHLVFISKENRTYDEVFGQIEKGKGDPTLARYGRNATFTNRSKTLKVHNATVMPNHLALAGRFAIADNFYVDSDVSADGHRWLVNTYPNEWVETNTAASYGGNREYRSTLKAPGSLGMNGSAGAIYPEDYNEAGSMWDHLARNNLDFFNFGFGVMLEPASYEASYKDTGIRHLYNFPLPAPMYTRTSRTYPTYNMAIPDQYRVEMFIKEFTDRWGTGRGVLPPVITLILPNDHGAGERPDAGYPFRESYMADNDLALGRIVEFLSRTPYWRSMAIVVTEDDAQNGVDHVDAHRSILMLVSPYARQGYVSHAHFSFGSIFKTFWNILGMPYLNQFDAAASDLADMFARDADTAAYDALPVDRRIFDPQKALDPLDETFSWKAVRQSPVIDDPVEMLRESKEREADRVLDRERRK
jgi:YVTN family beta-propeller protein